MNEEIRILLVDDDLFILKTTMRLLAEKGYVVETAENGTLGLELARLFQPHLILLDYHLPDVNGIEVCQHIKQVRT